MSQADTDSATEVISRLVHKREYHQGITLPLFAGLAADRYLDVYSPDPEALAAVAVKNHQNAAPNPYAQFQYTIEAAKQRGIRTRF